MLTVAAALAWFLAWGLLCLNAHRARADLGFGVDGRWPKVLAPVLALAALAACRAGQGAGLGLLLWVCLGCATAIGVAGLLTLLRRDG